MRRIVGWMLILIMLLCSSGGLADEILFRGIPWLSDYQTVIKAFEKDDVVWNTPSVVQGEFVDCEIDRDTSSILNYQCVYSVSSSNCAMKVAGYPVSGISLKFVFKPNAEGIIDHKAENTAFYLASYFIEPSNMDVAMKDLQEKLMNIYGKVIKTDDSSDCNAKYHYVYWNGDNETTVALVGEYDSSSYSSDRIYIYYGCLEGNNLISQADKIQEQIEADKKKDEGSDGL